MAVDDKAAYTKAELLELAKADGVAVDAGMTKAQVIAALETRRPAEKSGMRVEAYDTFIYVGPSLPRGQLQANAVFRGSFRDVTAYLAPVLAAYPQAAQLLVPTRRLAAFAAKVRTPGNMSHKHYNDLVSTLHQAKEGLR